VVTRIFVPYVQEAFQLLEEGAVARAIDAAASGDGARHVAAISQALLYELAHRDSSG